MARTHYPQRKSPRLKDYDYSLVGAYFLTLCTQNRHHLFGEIVDDGMVLNAAGHMIWTCWQSLPQHITGLDLDHFVVMPNHVHGIVVLKTSETLSDQAPVSIPLVMQTFKSFTTHQYIQGVRNEGWPPFDKHVWQRSYHDHIIRNEMSLNKLREYIEHNPARWAADYYYADV